MNNTYVIDTTLQNFASLKSQLDARVALAKRNKQNHSVAITESYSNRLLVKTTYLHIHGVTMSALTVLTTDSTLETFDSDYRLFESTFSSVRSSGTSCDRTRTEIFNYEKSGIENQTTMLKYQMYTIVIV